MPRCRVSVLLFAVVAIVSARSAGAQSCPASSEETRQGDVTEYFGSGQLYNISEIFAGSSVPNIQPCETVSFTLTFTLTTDTYGNPRFRMFNSTGDTLIDARWSISGTFSIEMPGATTVGTDYGSGSPYPASRSPKGIPYSFWIDSTCYRFHYTVKVARHPRPGYNVGGTDFVSAPTIQTGTHQYGTIHLFEDGQVYKVRLQPGQKIYLRGSMTAKADAGGAALKIRLYDSGLSYLQDLVSYSGSGTTQFPSPPLTFTHNGGSPADFYLKLSAPSAIVQAFDFIVDTPKLTLYLDVDGNFNPLAPITDAPQYLPGSDLGGYSVTLPQNNIQVYAGYADSTGIVAPPTSGSVTFALTNVSAFVGMAMNAANPSGRSDTAPDFETLSPLTASFDATTHVARLDLQCWDYGGFATVSAAHAGTNVDLRLPLDDQPAGGNWLPDSGWKVIANGSVIGQVADVGQDRGADDEVLPSGNGTPGDGLTAFEEYRGFIVRNEHRRLNTAIKDLFIDSVLDTTSVNVGYANNLPLTKHLIWSTQYDSNGYVNAFNTNSGDGGAFSHTDQRVIIVREAAYWSAGRNGDSACVCPPNASITPSHIYVSAIREQTPTHLDQTTVDPSPSDPWLDDAAISKTVAHEVGHRIAIDHYDWAGAGSRLTVMVLGFDVWPGYYGWGYFPNYYDDTDLVQFHIR